jgi:hypothetical protein
MKKQTMSERTTEILRKNIFGEDRAGGRGRPREHREVLMPLYPDYERVQ